MTPKALAPLYPRQPMKASHADKDVFFSQCQDWISLLSFLFSAPAAGACVQVGRNGLPCLSSLPRFPLRLPTCGRPLDQLLLLASIMSDTIEWGLSRVAGALRLCFRRWRYHGSIIHLGYGGLIVNYSPLPMPHLRCNASLYR